MKTKKFLSILLALMMMLSVVPMYASAAEALSASNVTQWPTVSYKNADGKMYYGQTQSEGLIINDDEIVLDSNGNQVAGHFELRNPDTISSPGTNMKLNITFVPDNTDEYAGFNKSRSVLLYSVEKVALVPVDENDTIPVATEVEAGSTLSTSTLSGAVYTNPINANEPNLLAQSWRWAYPSTVVNESGYYEARFSPAGYDEIVAQVYVRIAGEIPETTIAEVPTVDTQTYDGVTTWGDVELKGGKAVLKIEGTEVAGTFAVKENWKTALVRVGSYEIDVTFTPDDPEAALPYSLKIPVTVNKGQIKFVDENGNEIVPKYTIPYGHTLSGYEAPIFDECKKYLNTGDENIRLYFSEEDSKTMFDVGTYELTIGAAPYYTTSNYLRNDNLKVKITVESKTLNAKIGGGVDGYYVVDSSVVYHVKGTFDVYVNDELIASDVAYNSGKVKWEATENGTYTMKWVYNPVENDNFIINDVTTTMNVIFPNTITYSGISAYILNNNSRSELFETTERKQGSSVTIGCDLPAFATWVITDAKGNAVDLGIEDLTATEITFVMPDYDIVITTKTELEIAAENCDHICHSDNPLFRMLWKVLTFIFRLFDVQQYCDCGNLHYDAPLFG